jgi:hypothetical protein
MRCEGIGVCLLRLQEEHLRYNFLRNAGGVMVRDDTLLGRLRRISSKCLVSCSIVLGLMLDL